MQNATTDVEKMLLGNKCDLEQLRVVSTERGRMVSKINNNSGESLSFADRLFLPFKYQTIVNNRIFPLLSACTCISTERNLHLINSPI